MTFSVYLVFSLVGAALLGFATAWYWQKHYLDESKEEIKELEADLRDERNGFSRLKSENETQKLSIENLQKLMQGIENQTFTLEQQLKQAHRDNDSLRDEKHRLMAEVELLMKEYESIREMPAIDLALGDIEDEEGEIDIRTKAKKLVRAFKKGYSGTDNPPPSNS